MVKAMGPKNHGFIFIVFQLARSLKFCKNVISPRKCEALEIIIVHQQVVK